jgi:hypothetical protein
MTLTRRRVLGALAAAGGAGALTGHGTAAILGDREGAAARFQTGFLDLAVEYELRSGPGADDPETNTGVVDGPRLHLPLGTLTAAEPDGSLLVTFELPELDGGVNNPASLWLASDCPVPTGSPLAAAIELTLSTADCSTGAPIDTLVDGSLIQVGEQLQQGLQVDGDPGSAETDCLTDRTCLLVEYTLGDYVGEESVELPLWFGAVQCRHGADTNPFAAREPQPCAPADPCPCCRTIGKLELEGDGQPGLGESFVAPGTYTFTEGSTSLGLEIYDTAEKDDGAETTGVAFRLVALDAPGAVVPDLCSVLVKGGNGHREYTDDLGRGTDTAGLDGSEDGLLFAPAGTAISHVTVCVCTTEAAGDCPGCTDPSIAGASSSEEVGR